MMSSLFPSECYIMPIYMQTRWRKQTEINHKNQLSVWFAGINEEVYELQGTIATDLRSHFCHPMHFWPTKLMRQKWKTKCCVSTSDLRHLYFYFKNVSTKKKRERKSTCLLPFSFIISIIIIIKTSLKWLYY